MVTIAWVYVRVICCLFFFFIFLFQAEDGIRDLVRSRGLGDVYKRQAVGGEDGAVHLFVQGSEVGDFGVVAVVVFELVVCLSLIHI